MDATAQRRIEQRLARAFSSVIPSAADAQRGLQTWGSFFAEQDRPTSPYTSLFLRDDDAPKDEAPLQDEVEHADGREEDDQPPATGSKRSRGEDEDNAKKRKENDASGEGGDAEEDDEDDDDDESASESDSSSDSGSEESCDVGDAPSFRRRVDDNRAYQAKRLREAAAKPG